MITLTKIEWADLTVNFWEGCTKVSPGCANCYAEGRDIRYHQGAHWGKGAPRKWVKAGEQKARRMNQASRAGLFCFDHKHGRRVEIKPEQKAEMLEVDGREVFRFTPVRPLAFCMSLGDFFDVEVAASFRIPALRAIANAPHIDWMILTKRPERAVALLRCALAYLPVEDSYDAANRMLVSWLSGFPPPNIAIGTSIEDQTRLEERIDEIRSIPAAVRFLSCEPLLGPLVFPENLRGIDQIITGGESGSKARPCHPGWVSDIAKQAAAAGVDHHHKQWGEWVDIEITRPPKGWEAVQGQAIYIDQAGNVTGTGDRPPGSRCLWRAGKKIAGSEILDLDTGLKRHAKGLLKFPKNELVASEDT